VSFTTADDYRLAHREVKHVSDIPEECHGQHLIPLRAMQYAATLVKRAASKYQWDDVELSFSHAARPGENAGHQIYASIRIGPDTEVIAAEIQGVYPQYGELVLDRQEPATEITFGRDEMTRMIKRAAIVAADGSGIIRFTLAQPAGDEPAQLSVSATADEIGDFSGQVDAAIVQFADRFGGPAYRIAFNSAYFQDMLAVADETVTMRLEGTTSQGMFYSERGYHCIMPMFVKW
jgi:hypothetical protein